MSLAEAIKILKRMEPGYVYVSAWIDDAIRELEEERKDGLLANALKCDWCGRGVDYAEIRGDYCGDCLTHRAVITDCGRFCSEYCSRAATDHANLSNLMAWRDVVNKHDDLKGKYKCTWCDCRADDPAIIDDAGWIFCSKPCKNAYDDHQKVAFLISCHDKVAKAMGGEDE